jgi:L-serine dehydratase
MVKTINRGINTEGELPGKLHISRKASDFFTKYEESKDLGTLVFAFALAVSEENACGGEVVTAPTCGSSGVLPGVLFSYFYHYNCDRDRIAEALLVAGLIGNLVKENASISGAEVGCQGEVGTACAMASAAACYLMGGNNYQMEYAAEIGLEHHLGMTCDPVMGYVQIPCIERNALAAKRAYDAAQYAILTNGTHTIMLDSVIQVMKETGHDMNEKYKETSKGGLALRTVDENEE